MTPGFDYLIAFALGAFVGMAELASRYRDEPSEALSTAPSACYITINAAVASAALFIVQTYGWTFGTVGDGNKVALAQILVAGLSSMALLRSSLFTVRVGSHDIGIGPSAIVQGLLRATDSAVDRRRALARDEIVKMMDAVSFDKAIAILPAYCLELMQNLPPIDQQAFAARIDLIRKLKADNRTKSRLLGLAVINVMGTKVLIRAVDSLGGQIAL